MILGHNLRHFFSLSASFTVLGLNSTSKLQEVKRKYYQLAKVYHPDLNKSDKNANTKFAEITKAYKYIVENYDHEKGYYQTKSAEANEKENQGSGDSKFKNQKRQKTRMEEEEYEDFYQYDAFYKNSKKFRKPKVGEDIYLTINITLQESILGVQKNFQYTKYEPCPACHDKDFSACFTCGGKGEIYDRTHREKVSCQYCSGKGFKNDCFECLGASYVLKEVQDKVYIEKGTKDKTILKIEKKGHSGYKANNGHLYITVFIEENNKFKVDGNNVHMEYDLDYITAAVGGKVEVETVYGKREIEIQAGTQSGSQIRLFNLGLKSPYSKRMGDQILKIRIKMPEKLNPRQRKLLHELYKSES